MTDGEGSQPQQTPSTGKTPPAGQTPPATETAANGDKSPEDMTVGELVFEVSDQASVLIREEIELAKTEVTEKFNSLLRGSIAGLVAGIFALLALASPGSSTTWSSTTPGPGSSSRPGSSC